MMGHRAFHPDRSAGSRGPLLDLWRCRLTDLTYTAGPLSLTTRRHRSSRLPGAARSGVDTKRRRGADDDASRLYTKWGLDMNHHL